MNDRLYRSREDRLIGGVCAGVADRLDLDPSIVRIGWALLSIFTGGAFLVLYIVMLIVVPEEPIGGIPPMPQPPGPGAVPGWQGPGAGYGAGEGSEPLAGDPATAGWQAPPGADSASSAAGAAWIPPDEAYAARRAERAERHRRREGTVGLIFGLLLILLGIWFLFREYIPDIDLEAFWPVAIIAVGVLLLVRAFRSDRGGDGA